jgi:hypothetical protein
MTLEPIQEFQVPSAVVETTDSALREAGTSGYERFVLWTGSVRDERFSVEHVYIPDQRSYRGEDGLHVRVDAPELNRLNRWLYENKQLLAVQVHSHPKEAYHSETDNRYPIVTTLGGLSIVVPNFGRDGIRSSGTVAYRLSAEGWVLIDAASLVLLQLII